MGSLYSTPMPEGLYKKIHKGKEGEMMKNGIYRIDYMGEEGAYGYAEIEFKDNTLIGSDVRDVRYFGTYSYNQGEDEIDAVVSATVPPGVPLVTGIEARMELWGFDFEFSFPNKTSNTPFDIKILSKNIKAIIKFLR